MASAELKVVVIALLILAVGFFYTNVRDKMTGYVPAQRDVDMKEYGFEADESYQALPFERTNVPSKEPVEGDVYINDVFKDAHIVNPCLDDVPPQIQTLLGGVC